mmetsp:Transcript_14570/g.36800  ORF Transcript_14570/g.36800 Transcript_14570/m.36800 type:complete len:226 (-) Transcript_14570:1095-1772(-)
MVPLVVQVRQFHSVEGDVPSVRVIEALDQLDCGALAAAAGTHDADLLAGPDLEAEALADPAVRPGRVGEVDPLEGEASFGLLLRLALGALRVDLGLPVQQPKYVGEGLDRFLGVGGAGGSQRETEEAEEEGEEGDVEVLKRELPPHLLHDPRREPEQERKRPVLHSEGGTKGKGLAEHSRPAVLPTFHRELRVPAPEELLKHQRLDGADGRQGLSRHRPNGRVLR